MQVCTRYHPDTREAEQLLHDSFLKIFKQMGSYTGKGSFEGWMKRICINTCLDHLRKQGTLEARTEKATLYKLPEETGAEDAIPDAVFQKLAFNDLLHLIEQLPPKEKTVFKLHVLDGYPHAEISHFLNIKPNHSHWLLHQARKLLQTLIVNRLS